MCKGDQREHVCGHTSIKWSYCRHSTFDYGTHRTDPCSNVEFGETRQVRTGCPLENCAFRTKGGRWVCCQCRQGPNTTGWCTRPVKRKRTSSASGQEQEMEETCDHGSCQTCFQSRECKAGSLRES